MAGKVIELFLTEGSPTGVIFAKIKNWTGQVFFVNSDDIDKVAKRREVSQSGVYVLASSISSPIETVYIGESDNVISRIPAHYDDPKKSFWERTAIITSSDDSLTKADVRYLESRLIDIATQSQRAICANEQNPEPTFLPESGIAVMEEFLENVRYLLPVLGFNFLLPNPTQSQSISENTFEVPYPRLRMAARRKGFSSEAIAYGKQTENGFVVFAGSTANKQVAAKFEGGYASLRNQLIQKQILVNTTPESDYLVFSQDFGFGSPSAAASIVAGTSVNGRDYWVIENTGVTLGMWQKKQVQTAINTGTGSENI